MRFHKLPILRAIKRRIIKVRSTSYRRHRFRRGLNQIQELNGQFYELRQRWINRGDETARQRANNVLKKIYRIIRKLSRNNHRRELQVFLRNQQIPGWRRAIPGNSRQRR